MSPNIFHIIYVFISSTFKDMDFERDYLKDVLFPRLNKELEEYNIKVELCDLRSGIANIGKTEEEQDDFVLTSCFSAIQKSIPYFIALIGGRYGWAPPTQSIERLREVLTHYGIDVDSTMGKSVTEIEISLGCLLEHNLCNGIICFRSDNSYANIPKGEIETYIEKDENARKKLKGLCDKIRNIYKQQHREGQIIDYKLYWQDNNFHGLEEWGEKVLNVLKNQIVMSYERQDSPTGYRLKQAMDRFVFNKVYKSIDFSTTWSVNATKGVIRQYKKLVCIANEGAGATTFLCQHYTKVLTDTTNVFPIFYSFDCIDSEMNFANMIRYLTLMTNEYVKQLYDDIPECMSEEALDKLEHVVNLVYEKDYHILFIIDSYHKMNKLQNPYSNSLRWVPKNSAIIISCDVQWHSIFCEEAVFLPITPLTRELAYKYIKSMGYTDITDNIIEKILSPLFQGDNLIDDKMYSRTPLWIKMVIELIVDLNREEYKAIRNSKSKNYYEALKKFREMAIPKEPIIPELLFLKLVNRYQGLIQQGGVTIIFMLALSKNGLRESTMRHCMEISEFEFTKLFSVVSNKYRHYFSYSPESNKWYFQYDLCKRSIFLGYKKYMNVSHIYESILNELLPYSIDEKIVQDDLFYYIVNCNNYSAAEIVADQGSSQVIDSGASEIAEGLINKEYTNSYTEWCKNFLLFGSKCSNYKIVFITKILEKVGSLGTNRHLANSIKELFEIIINNSHSSCNIEIIDFCNLLTDIYICEDLLEDASCFNECAIRLIKNPLSDTTDDRLEQLSICAYGQHVALYNKNRGLIYDKEEKEVSFPKLKNLMAIVDSLEKEIKKNPQNIKLKEDLVGTYIDMAIEMYDTNLNMSYYYYNISTNLVKEIIAKPQSTNDLRTCASNIFRWCTLCVNSGDYDKGKEGLTIVLMIDRALVRQQETKENLINIIDVYNMLIRCCSKEKNKKEIQELVGMALGYISQLKERDFEVCCKLWMNSAENCKEIGAYYEAFYIYDTMADEMVFALQEDPRSPYLLLLIDTCINISEVIFLDGDINAGVYRMQYAFHYLEEARGVLHSKENIDYMNEQEQRCNHLLSKYYC